MPDLMPLATNRPIALKAPGKAVAGVAIDARPDKAIALRPAAANSSKESARIKQATEEFEGLLLSQMLQSIRESAQGGWQEHDQAGAVAIEMAETQLARVMASQGGLGIARTLQASLDKRHPEPNGSGS